MLGKRMTFLMTMLLCCGAISGCAVTHKENRLVMNSLDDAVQGSAITSSTTGKVLAAPIAFPVG